MHDRVYNFRIEQLWPSQYCKNSQCNTFPVPFYIPSVFAKGIFRSHFFPSVCPSVRQFCEIIIIIYFFLKNWIMGHLIWSSMEPKWTGSEPEVECEGSTCSELQKKSEFPPWKWPKKIYLFFCFFLKMA